MTKHVFLAYAFREQQRYLRRHLVKPRSMKLGSFISRLQGLNAYLEEFPPDTDDQETAPLFADDTMDIIYYSMPTTWKNKMIEQGFNYKNSTVKQMTEFFETRIEILELREYKKGLLFPPRKRKRRIAKRLDKEINPTLLS